MSKRSNINDILHAIGRRDNILGLELGQNGCAGLQLQNGDTVFFEWHQQADVLFIYLPIIRLPDKEPQRALQMQTLLTLNCLSYGATFALKGDNRQVLLQQGLPVQNISMEQVDNAIDQLIAQSLPFKKGHQTGPLTPHDTASHALGHARLTHFI